MGLAEVVQRRGGKSLAVLLDLPAPRLHLCDPVVVQRPPDALAFAARPRAVSLPTEAAFSICVSPHTSGPEHFHAAALHSFIFGVRM
jgi:hypothetical protein